jgi:hypothetical protein
MAIGGFVNHLKVAFAKEHAHTRGGEPPKIIVSTFAFVLHLGKGNYHNDYVARQDADVTEGCAYVEDML